MKDWYVTEWRKGISITVKFLVIVIVIVLVTTGALLAVFFYSMYSLSYTTARANIEKSVVNLRDNITFGLKEYVDMLDNAAYGIQTIFSGKMPFPAGDWGPYIESVMAKTPDAQQLYFGSNVKWNVHGGYWFSIPKWTPDKDWDQTVQMWFINAKNAYGQTVFSEPYLYIDADTSDITVTLSKAIYNKQDKSIGVAAVDITIAALNEKVAGIQAFPKQELYLLNKNGLYITNPDINKIMKVNFFIEHGLERFYQKLLLFNEPVRGRAGDSCFFAAAIPHTEWILVSLTPYHDIFADTNKLLLITLVLCLIFLAAAIFITYKAAVATAKPIKELANTAAHLAMGDTEIRLALKASHSSRNETVRLAAAFKNVIETASGQAHLANKIAGGNTRQKIKPRSDKDTMSLALAKMIAATNEQATAIAQLANNDLRGQITPRCKQDILNTLIKKLIGSLNRTIGKINSVAGNIAGAGTQISDDTRTIADGVKRQTSTIEQISVSLEKTSFMTKQNADYSNQGKALIADVTKSLSDANKTVKRVAGAVSDIKTLSQNTESKMAEILEGFDKTAIETNLSALSEVVEFARGGETGKNFATVVEAARNLIMRSVEAAENTAGMAKEVVKNAEESELLTKDSAKQISQTIEHADKAENFMTKIASASNEQAQSIDQANAIVTKLGEATQQYITSSEQSAKAAEKLNRQTTELAELTGVFKFGSVEE